MYLRARAGDLLGRNLPWRSWVGLMYITFGQGLSDSWDGGHEGLCVCKDCWLLQCSRCLETEYLV